MDSVISSQPVTSALHIQLPQGDTKAYPVAATDIAVDDDRSDRGMKRAGAALQCSSKFLVDLDIRGAEFVERTRQARLRVSTHLRRQITWVE